MPFPVVATLSTRAGKVILVCAISSACAALLFSQSFSVPSKKPRADGDDADELPAQPLSRDAEASRAARAAAASAPQQAASAVPDVNAANAAASAATDAETNAAKSASSAPPPAMTVRSVPLHTSFDDAMQRLGVNAATTALLVHAYAGVINFHRDLREGDTVSIVVAPPAASGPRNAADSEPLAVRVQHGTTSHDLFLHRNLQGKPFYYTKSGAATTPSFERYPLAYSRVSSGFALRRLDPVTHQWQSHDGVDLAAPAGTPVYATARGTVSFIGRERGYGRIVVLNNVRPYQTAFAHLSRFAKGLHRGSRVRRGQVIGYVGSSGWATGPHLHFEVRVHHVPRDPLTVALPGNDAGGLHGDEQARFAAQAQRLSALL
ncbi:M23 family metallopeptidase [Paraburkholderia rhizosphaerae]|uniref:Murein DD-endopeptidase MepM/ murein hydrolase activator NlpD n=1 Tax=Paraburkholderia rhizosphaerae TaxID=480658 RepID=A0A4R8LJ49_9BURK|nr:M23 family metallopeptidase [Paraburkholderia rhizosphaerae]TDY42463.1 murein DD-endopeptidase MepM/ murein hydrolase activator NlpD [Paraburkholderia rhizosphaerae]